MAVGVEDGLSRTTDSQGLAVNLTVSGVTSTTVCSEMGSLVDNRPGLGISTQAGGFPEAVAEVDDAELTGS